MRRFHQCHALRSRQDARNAPADLYGIAHTGGQEGRTLWLTHGHAEAIYMNPITSFLVFVLAIGGLAAGYRGIPYIGVPLLALAALVAASLKMANVWQKFVILRMGKLQSVRGAGLFAIIPVLDNVVAVIDERIQTTAFNAEQALTRDTVPGQCRCHHLLACGGCRKGGTGHYQLS